jgi:DnaK suppressor protein
VLSGGGQTFAKKVFGIAEKGGCMSDLNTTMDVNHDKGAAMKAEKFLPDDYRPAEDEPFMNERQVEYFRRKLFEWKSDLLAETRDTIEGLQDSTRNIPDVTDRASEETDRALELRTRDRQRKLVLKIDSALRRIDEGEYGYCEVTGEPISLKRLDARPIATMSLEAQERHERREKVHRDD